MGEIYPIFQDQLETFQDKLENFQHKHETFQDKLESFQHKLETFQGKLESFQHKHEAFQGKLERFQDKVETFQDELEIDRSFCYTYRYATVTEHSTWRRVEYMSGRQGTKKQAVAKKDRMAVLNSHAVEINRFLAGKRQFLDDAGKLAPNLTGKERLRLFSAGVKNYGFIEKAYDVARGNPDFAPPHLNIENLAEGLREFDTMRQLVFELEQYLQAASDVMLIESDVHYRRALRIYDSLQEQTRSRVLGAEPLFEALRTFFKRRKRNKGEPTEQQIEKDVKKLVKGKADGEIIIKNESPRASGGRRTVVDNVRKGRALPVS